MTDPAADPAPPGGAFDEAWYLRRYGDVAQAVAQGTWPSGAAHYVAHGRAEGRLPVPPDQAAAPSSSLTPTDIFARHNGAGFLTPTDLALSATLPRRVALIGSCFLEAWRFHLENPSNCPVDPIVVNNAGTPPDRPPGERSIADYDLQIVQIPLRPVLRDGTLSRLPHDSPAAHERAFGEACSRVELHLRGQMEWNIRHGLLTFVANFFVPQRNPMGCLFPRYDLRNAEFFVERLNEHLERCVREYRNAYLLDVDRLAASIGRRHCQDDTIALLSHNGLIDTPGRVATRIEPMAAMIEHYDITWPAIFRDALWAEIVAMYRTVRQADAVKLVVVDLDDTLWNGVSGDMADIDPAMVEGWPLGFAEALLYLKKRGILLAVISKNDAQRIRGIWPRIFHGRLSIEDFAAIRINWAPKDENMRELLAEMSLVPRSVVFIDDNPAERAAMKLAFPEIRILGQHPYYLRRILLWSPETQIVSLTEESSRRTAMVQAQLGREAERKQFSRADFLRRAAPQVTLFTIDGTAHNRFARAFELINKTNQFNTTGRRWTLEECMRFFNGGGVFHAFEASDSYTGYGLVGVVLVKDRMIEQWVMSCRVLGYQIEEAVMAAIVTAIRARGAGPIEARLVETELNFPCRDLFANCGFSEQGGGWVLLPDTVVAAPPYVTMMVSPSAG